MAKTNYQIFNEENAPERTYNDSEYKEATQRVGGVMPGMALSRMHNKMYYQWSAMCKAIANLIVSHGHDCMDNDVEGITRYLEEAITSAATGGINAHRTASELDHPDGSVTTPKLRDAAVTGAKIANKAIGKEHLKDGVVDDKAPIASPALTGTPTVPTASKGTSTDQIASTAFVAQAIAALVNSAPGALDTLQELAAALGNDANFAATVTNALAGKVSKSGDKLTGPLFAPTIQAADGFEVQGDAGLFFKKHGGGWYMSDDDWMRAYGGRGIHTSGKIACDGGFEGNLRGRSDSTNGIAILTGVINDGGTIPLPDGYTESQCRWMVSPKSDNYNLSTWDIDESGGQKLNYTFYCHTEGRKVVCRSRHVGDDGDRTFLGSVNYIIIGVR